MAGRAKLIHIIPEAAPAAVCGDKFTTANRERQDWCVKWYNERYTINDLAAALQVSRERAGQLLRKGQRRRRAAAAKQREAVRSLSSGAA